MTWINMEIFFMASAAVFFSAYIILYIFYKATKKRANKLQKKIIELRKESAKRTFDLLEIERALKLFDKIIDEKIEFYFYGKILPIFAAGKTPDKPIIKEIIEELKINVLGSCQPALLNIVLNFYSERGLEIHINERVMLYINKFEASHGSKIQKLENGLLKNIRNLESVLP